MSAPNWYYAKDDSGEYFVVYANANNSCSKRRFNAATGQFVDKTSGVPGKSFPEVFGPELRASRRIGELQGRPNLENAVKNGRLSDDVLRELQRSLPRV